SPGSLAGVGRNLAGRPNDDAGVGRPAPPAAAVDRSRASALPRRRGAGQPKGSDPPPQSDARRAIHDKALGVATTTRRAVRGMTPTIKRVIVLFGTNSRVLSPFRTRVCRTEITRRPSRRSRHRILRTPGLPGSDA